MPRFEQFNPQLREKGYEPTAQGMVEVHNQRGKYLVLDLKDSAGFDIGEFDALTYALDKPLESAFSTSADRGQSMHSPVRDRDFTTAGTEIMAYSSFKFIIAGMKMYIFSTKPVHFDFYNSLKEKEPVQCAGKLRLSYRVRRYTEGERFVYTYRSNPQARIIDDHSLSLKELLPLDKSDTFKTEELPKYLGKHFTYSNEVRI
jgi:hypothetical protein